MKKLDRWSYSSWSALKTCAFRFHKYFILGEKPPDNFSSPAMQRGIKLHKSAEQYLKRELKTLPYDFRELKGHYAGLRKMDPIVERFWGVNPKWKPTLSTSWVVMKMDAAVEPVRKTGMRLIMQDLKTGRIYPEHVDQASLFSTLGFAKYPKSEGVDMEFWYADQEGHCETFEFDRETLIGLREYWIEQGQNVVAVRPAKTYLPMPSENACKWCVLRSDRRVDGKRGVCDAWKQVRGVSWPNYSRIDK